MQAACQLTTVGEKPRGGKAPWGKSPVGKSPVGKSPVGKKPRGEKPRGEKTPWGKNPVGKKPRGEKAPAPGGSNFPESASRFPSGGFPHAFGFPLAFRRPRLTSVQQAPNIQIRLRFLN